jgi:hypothetical protein
VCQSSPCYALSYASIVLCYHRTARPKLKTPARVTAEFGSRAHFVLGWNFGEAQVLWKVRYVLGWVARNNTHSFTHDI